MRTKHTILACCVAALALSACSNKAQVKQPDPYAGAPRISSKIENQGVVRNVKVTDLRQRRRDNLIHIQAEITNLTNKNQQIYYRFKWLDQNGFNAWEDEVWKPLLVYGSQKKTITTVSPTFNATDFRLILQSSEMYARESGPQR